MNSNSLDAHIDSVRELSRPGQCLGPGGATQTVNNPAWFVRDLEGPEPTTQRRRLHSRLIAEARPDGVAENHRAIVLAGPPGAGKSTALRALLPDEAERATFLHVDPDEFKIKLLQEAVRDGSYEDWIMPAQVREREAAGERFYPLELASLVHEESSTIATRLRNAAVDEGANVIIDGVLASEGKALALGRQLQAAGYEVTVVDVEVPREISEEGIRARWRESYEAALAGENTLGGRWVPSDYARDVFDGPGGKSKPEHAARVLAEQCGAVMNYRLYRLDVAQYRASGDRNPVLEVELHRGARGGRLVDPSTAQGLRAVEASRPPVRRTQGPRPPGVGRE